MGASAAALPVQAHARSTPLRALRAWHLFSLDAPTVACCWALLFAAVFRVPHPVPAAADLACAVWLVYMIDRVLDARRHFSSTLSTGVADPLFTLYRVHARAFLYAGAVVTLLGFVLVSVLPRALMEAWVLLTLPLLLYAAVVHLLHLTSRWKAISVGIFFSVAAALPAAVSRGLGWPVVLAAVAFGGVCRANCAVLRASSQRMRLVFVLCTAAALLPLRYAECRAVAVACLLALGLLLVLRRQREMVSARVGAIGWRSLVDVALVAPALVVAASVLLLR